MIRRLFDRIFGFLGVGYGWCGGCQDPDCMDCVVEWGRKPVEPSWDMGCGHFDSYGDPNHDCSTWDDEPSPRLEDDVIGYDGFGAPIYPHQVAENDAWYRRKYEPPRCLKHHLFECEEC